MQTLEKPWLVGLRNYQLQARREIIKAWSEGCSRVLFQLCTGGGKSIIIRSFLLEMWTKRKKVLLVCQDTRILIQLVGHAIEAGIPQDQIGVLKAWKSREYPLELFKPVQVAMIQSLTNNWDDLKFGLYPLTPDVIIVDECHHSSHENNYFQLWEQFPEAKLLGLSATPARPNGGGFYFPHEEGEPKRHLFDRLIKGVTKRELIDSGFLPECETYIGLTPNLKGVAKKKGEFKVEGANGLEERFNSAVIRGDIIRCWREFVYDRFGATPTMCFGVSVEHIKAIAADFRANNIPALALHGNLTKIEQDEALRSFITGKAVVLCLCGMGQEGFDLSTLAKSMGLQAESVFCVIKALATASLVKNSQLDGRVRGIDLMHWDWRELPTGQVTPEGNQPQEGDVVLGGSRSPIKGAMVLGGMAGIEALLKSKDLAGRLAGIKKALALSRLDLLEQCKQDPSPQIQALVEAILENHGLASAGKLLYGVIIDCGNNFERFDIYDAEHEWTLDGVKPSPLKSKQCPECNIAGLKINLDKCPNCGHVFFKVEEPQEVSEPTGEGVSVNHDKDCPMAMLDKAAWNCWQGLLAQNSNYVALKEFIRSGAKIPEIAIAGKQCKTKEGKTYKGYGIYKIWLDCQRETHGNLWLPTLETLEIWCDALNYPRATAKRWLEECKKFDKTNNLIPRRLRDWTDNIT
jgi:hypothetical protein